MNLRGLNVLVDGYNLEMANGTGIKTYTHSLIQALNLLDANVSVLFSRPSSRNPKLNEVLFFDRESKTSNLKLLKDTIKYLAGTSKEAELIKFSDKVIIQDNLMRKIVDSVEFLNTDNCYNISKLLYHTFGVHQTIYCPKKISIWHRTYPVIPIKIKSQTPNVLNVTTIHDLVPLKLPYTTLDNKKIFYNAVKSVLKDSEIILTVSENSKKDILDFYDVDPDKIHVTYQSINQPSVSLKDEEIFRFLKRFKLNLRKYILFVGAIEPKKNIGRLIDAYAAIDTDLQLVIVGKKGWMWEGEIGKIESLFGRNWTRKVKLLDYVTNDSLKYLYAGAFCFVFPSIYEGFGLPPLEAMSLECPVITSKTSCLSEICGDAALYVDPYESDDIRKSIEFLINNPDMRTPLIAAGKERVKLFSLENYSQRLYQAYAQAL
jgi:glycosyltransferase involved in cell wall biosynthesis